MVSCIEGLVGLTDSDCPCIEADDQGHDNSSSTGFYVTHEMNSILPLLASQDCGDGSIWDILNRARSKAHLDFLTDLKVAIYDKFDTKLKKFSGYVGEEKKGTPRSIKSYAGLNWSLGRIKGGKLTISEIQLGLDSVHSVDIKIWDTDYTTPLATANVTTVANEYVTATLNTPLTLDLDDCEGYIRIGYDRPGDAAAIGNKLTCGCSHENLIWDQYIVANGYEVSSAPTETNLGSTGSYSNGLRVKAVLECDSFDFICDLESLDGYVAQEVIAKAIVFGSSWKAYQMILDSPNTNFHTLVNRETLYSKRNASNKEYGEYIEFIAMNIPEDINDCFTCKQDRRFQKSELLV